MSKFIQQIRELAARDANHVYDLDLKCFDNPWNRNDWDDISNNEQATAWVGCYRQVPISFLVLERQAFTLPNTTQKVGSLHIHKLGVKKLFRRKGVGVRLLAFAHQEAMKQLSSGWVTMAVPEWLVMSDSPNCILPWLRKYKFKALLTLPDRVTMYGKAYDQYLFGFKLK